MRKGTLKKALALALTGVVLVGAFAGCGAKKDSGDKKETKKIVIGASPSPHADILKVAKKELKKEGCDAYYFPSFEEIESFCLDRCQKGDVLITMGAGNVVNIGENLLNR